MPPGSPVADVVVVDPGAPPGSGPQGHGLTAAQLERLRWQRLQQLYVPPGPDSLDEALIAGAGRSIAARILAEGGPMLEAAAPGGRTVRQV